LGGYHHSHTTPTDQLHHQLYFLSKIIKMKKILHDFSSPSSRFWKMSTHRFFFLCRGGCKNEHCRLSLSFFSEKKKILSVLNSLRSIFASSPSIMNFTYEKAKSKFLSKRKKRRLLRGNYKESKKFNFIFTAEN
jgi:hypothetical protein